ncbi:MAG: NADAR family protein [Clostridia bacterium]|nr:NADAR family protein [Clostridia bacterium]
MAIHFYKEFGPLGYLATYSSHGFYKEDIFFKTNEHFYQYSKVIECEIKQEILDAETPKEASNIGRDRNNKIREDWDKVKQEIMLEGVLLKFRANPNILEKLLDTGEEEIVEDTVKEEYWGCGPNKTGQNNYGKILVKARTILREEQNSCNIQKEGI